MILVPAVLLFALLVTTALSAITGGVTSMVNFLGDASTTATATVHNEGRTKGMRGYIALIVDDQSELVLPATR
jgi:hypothetical protein